MVQRIEVHSLTVCRWKVMGEFIYEFLVLLFNLNERERIKMNRRYLECKLISFVRKIQSAFEFICYSFLKEYETNKKKTDAYHAAFWSRRHVGV